MRKISQVEKYRHRSAELYIYGTPGYEYNGVFAIPHGGVILSVVSSDGAGWDHVSVSIRSKKGDLIKRTPSWEELCFIKNLFWDEEETVIQYHPPKSQYVNTHDFTLHLWKPQGIKLPLPPKEFV